MVFTGKLDIGALVAVIGAHKELAAPWKELLQYYQDKEDARIKYDQVVAQFEPAGMLDDHTIDDEAEKYGPLEGSIIATNVSVTDDSGGTSLNGLDLTVPFDAHVAVVGGAGSGTEEVGLLFSRLMMPTSGNLMMGQHRAVDLPEAVTGRQLAYVGPSSILFNASVRDNLYYGLKHRPLADMPYTGADAATRRRYIAEAQMSGNTPSDLAADWIDYSAAGVRDMADLTAKTITVLRGVELGERGRALLGRHGAQLVAQRVEPGRREELQHQPEGQVVLAGVHAAGAQEAGEVGGGRVGRVQLRHRGDERQHARVETRHGAHCRLPPVRAAPARPPLRASSPLIAPAERFQGESVRIMYIHVPAAWLGMSGWTGIAVAGLVQLVWRHPLAGVAARAIAVPGALFTAICLITGSIWGRPTWGTWWEWDGRMTSMLVLLFLYFGYIALANASDERTSVSRATAV